MPMTRRRMAPASATAVVAAAIGVDVLLSACGGGVGPTPLTFSTDRVTVTITESGVSPAFVTVPVCRETGCLFYLQFVNRDSQSHDMKSDPHPTHTDCPMFNTVVGTIAPGQTKEWDITNCPTQFAGYHDETRPDDARFQGRVSWAR